MGITVEFKSYEEMVAFAHQLIGKSEAYVQPVQETPAQQEAPQTTVTIAQPQTQQQVTYRQQTNPVKEAPAQAQQTQQPVQTTNPVQTSSTDYTMDDLAKAAMTLMDAGRQGELLNLLAQFGVDALPSLPQEQYGAFATALRGLGAQI